MWWQRTPLQNHAATPWCQIHCQGKAFPSMWLPGFATSLTTFFMTTTTTMATTTTTTWWTRAAGPPTIIHSTRCQAPMSTHPCHRQRKSDPDPLDPLDPDLDCPRSRDCKAVIDSCNPQPTFLSGRQLNTICSIRTGPRPTWSLLWPNGLDSTAKADPTTTMMDTESLKSPRWWIRHLGPVPAVLLTKRKYPRLWLRQWTNPEQLPRAVPDCPFGQSTGPLLWCYYSSHCNISFLLSSYWSYDTSTN